MTTTLAAELIGYAAATLGTFVMLPQLVKTMRTKSAHDVSGIMLAIYLVQNVLWFIYGVMIAAIPLILCNVVAFFLCSIQAYMKWRFEPLRVAPSTVLTDLDEVR